MPLLRRLYRHIAVTTSPTTSARAVTALAAADAHAGTPASDTRGPLYRLALRRALAGGTARVHYLDFDRALHWLLRTPRGRPTARPRVPRELAAVLRIPTDRRILIVGRTPHAHRSHQRPLWITETRVNAHFASRLGIAGRVDFLAPSFIADRATTRLLVARSRARGARIYGELVGLLAGLAPELVYVDCDGLDWETPDRARAVVSRVGLSRWRARFDTPAEWRLRTAFVAQFIDGFERALARHPIGRVPFSRLRLRPPPLTGS